MANENTNNLHNINNDDGGGGENLNESAEQRIEIRENLQYDRSSDHFNRLMHNVDDDESRWLELEQNDYEIDQMPRIDVNPTSTLSHGDTESSTNAINGNFEDNFNRLHQIADKIKHTIREHLNSESSTCSDVIVDIDTKDNNNNNNSNSNCSNNNATTTEPFVNHYADQTLDEFKEELRLKREARQNAVQQMRNEIANLREQLDYERELNKRLRLYNNNSNNNFEDNLRQSPNALRNDNHNVPVVVNELNCNEYKNFNVKNTNNNNNKNNKNDNINNNSNSANNNDCDANSAVNNVELGMQRNRHAIIELANAQLSLQLANSENISLRMELAAVQKQCATLKEVVACCKQMMAIKEEQCNELKQKLCDIEKSFEEHEMKIMSENLRQEYEKQLLNIRQLRQLYEERQHVASAEYENLQRLISIKRDELTAEQEKTKKLTESNQQLKNDLDLANNELECLRDECKEHRYEKASFKEELGAVNTLFSQMILGFNNKNSLNLDRLILMLEENRVLLNEMANKELDCCDGATLPKLLFELVEQSTVCHFGNTNTTNNVDDSISSVTKIGNDDVNDHNDIKVNMEVDYSEPYCHERIVEGKQNVNNVHPNHNSNDNKECEGAVGLSSMTARSTAAPPSSIDNSEENNENAKQYSTASNRRVIKKFTQQVSPNTNPITDKCNRESTAIGIGVEGTLKVGAEAKAETATSNRSGVTAALLNLHEDNKIVGKMTSAKEIVGNLPKVWRVLMELLNHHHIEHVQFDQNGNGEDCYKTATATANKMSGSHNGLQAELSVSKTYLKLKDLILEKKSLVKETNRLKTLNSHLEYRLNEQEKRLSAVSLELTKTWHLVSKMQRQHRQLHTQEQILRYQLQQKRRLLCELKEELEYCRRKWSAARAKNDESQQQCDYLRREFAKRKLHDKNNHSGESGYSDSSGHSATEEEENDKLYGDGAKGGFIGATPSRKVKRIQSNPLGYTEKDLINKEKIHLRSVRCRSAPPRCDFNSKIEHSSILQNSQEVHTSKIKQLEQQCDTLLYQVLETSNNREELELQLQKFQSHIPKIGNIDNFERIIRANSLPNTSSLTPREEEYTRKRSERLQRLEEESRQLICNIKRTTDKGHYLHCSLDRLRRQPNMNTYNTEESKVENKVPIDIPQELHRSTNSNSSNSSNDLTQTNDIFELDKTKNVLNTVGTEGLIVSSLTEIEEHYTAQRSARLHTLENDSKQLLGKLSSNARCCNNLGERLDNIHEHSTTSRNYTAPSTSKSTIEERINVIEEISLKRDARLKRLEEEGKQLIKVLTETSNRGTQMINHLAEREMLNLTGISTTQCPESKSTVDENIISENVYPLNKDNPSYTNIVSENATQNCTTNQNDTTKGAIPKTKLQTQLYASQTKFQRLKRITKNSTESNETLEEMIQRLKDIPFPQGNTEKLDKSESKDEKENSKE